jgi:PKD repeat protein
MKNIAKQLSLCLALGLIIAGQQPVNAGPAESAGNRQFPQINLPDKSYGESAIQALGNTLPAVAAWYGMSTADFARLLRTDRSAWIDRTGRLLFIDEFPEAAGEEPQLPEGAAPFPLEDTFTLHSRPGASRVIYLDFDGHVTTGTAWNASSGVDPIVSPPYNREGDSSTFTDLELEYIQKMWRQVAEDFAPFDVDVTTEDPGQDAITRSSPGDQVYGTRVVVTVDNFDNCGCGGFAYLTAFNDVGDYYKPAFVFNTSLVGAGEAITHEAGHNLGLSHDGATGGTSYYQGHGSGETGWAPIMGVGYYKNLVQWSKGEYANANQTQDDIVRIQNYGAPMMSDDHGDTLASASALDAVSNGTTTTVSAAGLIRRADDIDVFQFVSGPGDIAIAVDPAPFSPNLDVLAELYDSQGNLVASANQVDALAAVINVSGAAAGEYFLLVDGTGKGDPLGTGYTDYGSLGRYTVSGTVPDAGGLQAPVAVASAIYTPGVAPLTVSFDGSASSDGDGSIVSYDWDFGDGASDGGVSTSNQYLAPGSYNATLTVTDNDGLSDSDTVVITVQNQAPVAVASVDTTDGVAPLPVNFDGSASYDPDSSGSVISWSWDFGDGNSSSEANPSHTYQQAGDYTAVLTVTDDLGDTASASTAVISVAPPPFVDQYTNGEIYGAGTVSGGYANTFYDDGSVQSIGERESGGRKSSRYSYLEHTWIFNVQPGNAVTVFLNAWQSNSSDGDQMLFAYSVNGGSYQTLAQISNTSDNGATSILLPSDTNGEVRIRVTDTDQSSGNRSLDTVYVDQLSIRTENGQQGTAPAAPTALAANALSSSEISLVWQDNSSDEYGFKVERSDDGGSSWATVATTGANVSGLNDTGLSSSSTYVYRVLAFNGAGNSGWSNEASATTDPGGAITLSASGYKRKGVKHVDLSWNGAQNVDVYRDGVLLTTESGTAYTDNIGTKGGGSYLYQVCEAGSGASCSNAVQVVF